MRTLAFLAVALSCSLAQSTAFGSEMTNQSRFPASVTIPSDQLLCKLNSVQQFYLADEEELLGPKQFMIRTRAKEIKISYENWIQIPHDEGGGTFKRVATLKKTRGLSWKSRKPVAKFALSAETEEADYVGFLEITGENENVAEFQYLCNPPRKQF